MMTFSRDKAICSLHIVCSGDNKLGGGVHAVFSAAAELTAAGHPAEVLATCGPDEDTLYLEKQFGNVRCHFLPRTFPKRFWNAAGMVPWLESNLARFDLVELHMIWCATTIIGWRAAQRAGKPFLVRPQSSLDPYDLTKHSLQKKCIGPFFVGPMLRDAAGVLLATQIEAERLVTYGARPKKFIVPLVVPELPASPSGTRQAFRRKHGIHPEAPVVLFLSRIDEKKGLQFLIPALANLRRRWPDLRLLLVGAGEADYTAKVQRLLADCDMREATVQTGFLSGAAKQEAFAASDIFALPSLNENFGMVVVEAMRAGLPLMISHEVYVHRESAGAGAGVVCSPSVESCERELMRLLEAGIVGRSHIGCRGVELADLNFSPTAATSRLLEVYKEVLALRSFSNAA